MNSKSPKKEFNSYCIEVNEGQFAFAHFINKCIINMYLLCATFYLTFFPVQNDYK